MASLANDVRNFLRDGEASRLQKLLASIDAWQLKLHNDSPGGIAPKEALNKRFFLRQEEARFS
jgi:hypothetical protein